MVGDLSREDVLREEALMRAREVHQIQGSSTTTTEKVLETARDFYAFLKGE